MPIAAANRGKNWVIKRAKVLNARGDSAAMGRGDAVQYEPATYDGFSCLQPVAANGLLGKFAGVLEEALDFNQERNGGLVREGDVFCKFKNHASAAIGTWAIPVTGEDYFTYNLEPTGILLLTDQTDGTAEHGPDETSAPKVRLYPNIGELGLVKTMEIQILDISTAAIHFQVAPCALQILTVQTVIEGAITSVDALVTVKNGAAGSTVAVVTVAYTGSAAGTVDETAATAANAVFARGDDISIETNGASTGTKRCTVVISYIELAVE